VREHIACRVSGRPVARSRASRAQQLAATRRCEVCFRERNGGKGAAVKTGFAGPRDHTSTMRCRSMPICNMIRRTVPKLVAASPGVVTARGHARAGTADLRCSAPRGRLLARKNSVFWAMTRRSAAGGRSAVRYRVLSGATALRVATAANAMDFDRRSRCVWCGPASRRARPDSGGLSPGRSRPVLTYARSSIRWGRSRARISRLARRACCRPSSDGEGIDPDVAEWLLRQIPRPAGTVFALSRARCCSRVPSGPHPAGSLRRRTVLRSRSRGARRASRDYAAPRRPSGRSRTSSAISTRSHRSAGPAVLPDREVDSFLRAAKSRVRSSRSRRRAGVLLLGAHLGSFEVMPVARNQFGSTDQCRGDFSNAERVNGGASLARPRPGYPADLARYRPVSAVARDPGAIDRGELVAILGESAAELQGWQEPDLRGS